MAVGMDGSRLGPVQPALVTLCRADATKMMSKSSCFGEDQIKLTSSYKRRSRLRRNAVRSSMLATAVLKRHLCELEMTVNTIQVPPGLHLPYYLPNILQGDFSVHGQTQWSSNQEQTRCVIPCNVFDQNKYAEENGVDGFADLSGSAFDKKDDAGTARATGANKNAEENGFDAFYNSAFDKRDDTGPLKATGATKKAEEDGFADFPSSAFDKQDHAGNEGASGATKETEDADDKIAAFASSAFDKKDGPGTTVVTKTNKIVEDDSEGFAVFSSGDLDKKDEAGSAEATGATRHAEVADGFADLTSSAFDKQDHAGTTCASEATKGTEDADDAIAAFSSSALDQKEDPGNAVVIGATKIVEHDREGFSALSEPSSEEDAHEATDAELAKSKFDWDQLIQEAFDMDADRHTIQATNLAAVGDHAENDESFADKANNAEGCNSRDAESGHVEKNSSVMQKIEHSFDAATDHAGQEISMMTTGITKKLSDEEKTLAEDQGVGDLNDTCEAVVADSTHRYECADAQTCQEADKDMDKHQTISFIELAARKTKIAELSNQKADRNKELDKEEPKVRIREQLSSKSKSEDKHQGISFLELADRKKNINEVSGKHIDDTSEQGVRTSTLEQSQRSGKAKNSSSVGSPSFQDYDNSESAAIDMTDYFAVETKWCARRSIGRRPAIVNSAMTNAARWSLESLIGDWEYNHSKEKYLINVRRPANYSCKRKANQLVAEIWSWSRGFLIRQIESNQDGEVRCGQWKLDLQASTVKHDNLISLTGTPALPVLWKNSCSEMRWIRRLGVEHGQIMYESVNNLLCCLVVPTREQTDVSEDHADRNGKHNHISGEQETKSNTKQMNQPKVITQQKLGIKMRKKGVTRTNGTKKKKKRGTQNNQKDNEKKKTGKKKTVGRRTKT